MSFSAQTCITDTGTTQLGSTLYFYSDATGFQSSFGSDLTVNITGDNCPYTMLNIPDGTTIVRVIDPTTNCCININLQSNDICNVCNLNFDVYESQTISQIVAGNLVGSCDNNISDYIINWYGPGSESTEIEFTSGYGTAFTDIGWDNTHPLTGSSSPLIQAGIYTPVIDRVIVNGITFSSTGAPGTYIANLDCFNPSQVVVEPLRCDNGNNVGDYSHHYLFENVSVGTPPQSLSASFLLSANTNYLAWRFKGFDVPDRLKLTYYGSVYGNNPITVENIEIGQDLLNSNFTPSFAIKSADTSTFYAKVICLTAFTITEGDYISIEITPNPTNNNTKWDFYFKCLQSFDCSSCLDNFKNSPYKIVLSSIDSNLVSCNRNQVTFNISGCTFNELSNSDTYKYFSTGYNSLSDYFDSYSQIQFNNIFYINSQICSVSYNNPQGASCGPPYTTCSISNNNTIIYSKSIVGGQGLINIKFSSFSDLSHYYNSYLDAVNFTGIFTDNTQYNFYRCISLKLPKPQNENEICGDTTQYETYIIHPTSNVSSGITSGLYEMTITMPTITQGLFPDQCQLNCNDSIYNLVQDVNQSSLSTSNNFTATSQTGSKYQKPFFCRRIINPVYNTFSGKTISGGFFVSEYANQTIPYSGNSNTFIPSLSSTTCNFINNSVTRRDFPSLVFHYQYVYYYRVELFDPNNINNFRIYGSPITNFQYSGATAQDGWTTIYELALEYSNGSITYQNPNYCI